MNPGKEKLILNKSRERRSSLVDSNRNNNLPRIDRISSGSTNNKFGENNATVCHSNVVLQTSMDGFWLIDLQGNILEVNDAYCNMIGYSRDELLSMNVHDIEASESPEEIKTHIKKILESGCERFETQHRRKDGTILDIEAAVNYLEIEKGFGFAFIRGITERKRTEEKLRISEAQFSKAFHSGPLLMAISAIEDGTYLEVNENFVRLSGYSREDAIGSTSTALGLISKEDRELLRQTLLTKGKVDGLELNFCNKSGEIFWCRYFGELIVVDGKQRVLSIVEDITERKLAEEKIEKQQYYLTKAQEIGKVGTWEFDIIKNRLIWTEQSYRIFGVPLGTELNYEIFLAQVHPDDREYVDREWNAAIEGKPYNIEHRIIVDGKIKWIREKAEILLDNNGQAVSAIGSTQDITERKRVEKELKQARDSLEVRVKERTMELLKTNKLLVKKIAEHKRAEAEIQKQKEFQNHVFESLSHPFYVIDANDYTITMANQAARSTEIYEGTTCHEHFHGRSKPCNSPKYICPLKKVKERKKPVMVEYNHYDKDNNLLTTEVYAYPLLDENGNVTQLIEYRLDITARKQTEDALLDSNEQLMFKHKALEEKNIALKEVLSQIEDDKKKVAFRIQSNIDRIVKPILRRLNDKVGPAEKNDISLLRSSLEQVTIPFVSRLEALYGRLTPREVEICSMIKGGLSSKEIASLLNTSWETVRNQRKHIRKKLGITGEKASLISILQTT